MLQCKGKCFIFVLQKSKEYFNKRFLLGSCKTPLSSVFVFPISFRWLERDLIPIPSSEASSQIVVTGLDSINTFNFLFSLTQSPSRCAASSRLSFLQRSFKYQYSTVRSLVVPGPNTGPIFQAVSLALHSILHSHNKLQKLPYFR